MTLSVAVPSQLHAEKKINWEKINPNLKGVASIPQKGHSNDQTECLLCHKDYIKAFGRTKHAKWLVTKFGKNLATICETCHGPMSEHLNEISSIKKQSPSAAKKTRAKFVVSFASTESSKKNAICLQCHENSNLMAWKGSSHEMMEISCDNCHYVMKKRGKQKLLITEDPKRSCFSCHRNVRAKMFRTSHMPLKEGKQDCSTCHNPHGGFGPNLLKRSTVNETCFMCHQEKRGPFLWQHPPALENCASCHESHGSNFRPLLKGKVPFLCQQCHMDVFHISDIYEGQKLRNRSSYIGGKSCLNCHSLIHGSNHPAGQRFQR